MSHLYRVLVRGGACLLVISACAGLLIAQTGKSKSKTKGGGNVKALDARVEKLESSLFRELVDISKLYEEAGQFERAKSMLEVLMKLNPNLPGLKEKLDQLESKMFDAQEIEFVFDTGKSWTPVGGAVVRGKPVRIEVEGEYKFQWGGGLTAEGLTQAEGGEDYIDSIPLGGLMAVVVNNGKPGKPIAIKSHMQWTPQEEGVLALKVNAPNGHKSTGKLTVKLSGLVRSEQ
jgi:hypothetical protein